MVGDLSVKGILRRHMGVTFAPGSEIPLGPLTLPFGFGSEFMRVRLENLSRTEFEHKRREPPVSWTARYEQTWTHIRVRVKLKGRNKDADEAIENGLDDLWEQAIETAWNGRFQCGAADELRCRFSFDVVWVDRDEHHTVKVEFVKAGEEPPRSNMAEWDTEDDGTTAAHEFGHMMGRFDEYEEDSIAPDREHTNTGTIMDTNPDGFSPRQFSRFAANLNRGIYTMLDVRVAPPF